VRWRSIVLAVAYSALAALAAVALLAYGAYDCYESCRYDVSSPPWKSDSAAWQWDAIFWLGVASGVASVAFLTAAFRLGVRAAAIALAAQLSFGAAGAVFVRAAGEAETSSAIVVLGGLAALGAALIAVRASRASSRAGGRGIRAGRNA
jgi:hypothetical protein